MQNDGSDARQPDDDSEPRSETIPGRDLANASYGANEREQTRDLRSRTPPAEQGDAADGGIIADLEKKYLDD